MPVDHVVPEKALHFLVNLARSEAAAVECGSGSERGAPGVHQFLIHSPWPEFADLPQAAEDRKFVVGHAHFLFVGLNCAAFGWDQFGGRDGAQEVAEDR